MVAQEKIFCYNNLGDYMKFIKWLDNFWYHYKFYTICAVFLIAVLAFTLTTIFTAEKYDFKVMLYLSQSTSGEFDDSVKKAIEKYGVDVNGDGEIKAQIVDISYNPLSTDTSQKMAQAATLSGELQNEETFIFLVDNTRFKELRDINAFSKHSDFNSKNGRAHLLKDTDFEKELSKNMKAHGIKVKAPKLYFCLRVLPTEDDMTEQGAAALKIKEKIIEE